MVPQDLVAPLVPRVRVAPWGPSDPLAPWEAYQEVPLAPPYQVEGVAWAPSWDHMEVGVHVGQIAVPWDQKVGGP